MAVALARPGQLGLPEAQIAQGEEHGHHQAAHAGRGQGHEQQQADIAQKSQSGQKTARGGGPQQSQQGQQGEGSRAHPPERNAAHGKVLIQGTTGGHTEIDVIAEGTPDAEGRCQQRDAQ